ncbi:MAG: hydantoinase [Proteobacteria bacterium]|nr:MAG: hydantoinase [Pseudomonadota bacterium]
MAIFNIGIDTGGTYTDAVILNTQTHDIVASTKALTARGDLSIGVVEALDSIMASAAPQVSAHDIALVSLSTTLATNALVEGQGAKIGVLLIGFDDVMLEKSNLQTAIPTAIISRIDGGHTHDGSEATALDEAAIHRALEANKGKVAAYAVAAHYSVRNPEHEWRAQALIREITGCPVTASCDLSRALNGPRRALTAAFNARIISLIVTLVDAVKDALSRHDIHAPLMIVKGDGSIASAETVVERPIETILSGPAASVIGANFLSGKQNFIVSDIGGTTTDVAIVKNGWPDLNEAGSMIGGFRTMVKAIDMQTIGLGGDSEVKVDHHGRIQLQTNRVLPLALLGHRWPSVIKDLKHSLGQGMGLGAATIFLLRPDGHERHPLPADIGDDDRQFLSQLNEGPVRWSQLVNRISDRNRVTRLVNRGMLQVAGFTPSDAAHVLGKQSQWSLEAAELVCLMIGRSHAKISHNDATMEEERKAFAQEVYDAMVAKSTHLLLEKLTGQDYAPDDPIIHCITQGKQHLGDLKLSLTPNIPLVAVGGPAQVFYKAVGERLNIVPIIPNGSEVANAVGAATGMIKVKVVVEISSSDQGGYRIHHEGRPLLVTSPGEALAKAQELAKTTAIQKAQAMHASGLETDLYLERLDFPNTEGDCGLISAKITASCVGSAK